MDHDILNMIEFDHPPKSFKYRFPRFESVYFGGEARNEKGMLPRVCPHVDERSAVSVHCAHYIPKKIQDVFLVSAVIENVVVDPVTGIALVTDTIDARNEIDAAALIARRD